jgi:feruloyl esterase
MFYPDAEAVRDWAYTSIDITTQTAKYLIGAYYGRPADHSYFVGCSTSGRQGMAMSQLFPTYYDGIIAGDPFYLPPDISLSETWGLEQIISISPKDTNGKPIYTQGFPVSDQNLFTNAILAACDGLDGLVDGVIDNRAACHFDPATFVFPSSGPYGSIAPGQRLQCTAAKTPTCLSPAQVTAVKKIAQGPRTSKGMPIVSSDGTLLSGYPFDGGFMQPSGIPTRDIGTATSPPGNIGLGSGQLPLFWFTVPNPTYNPLTVNYDTDIGLVTAHSPAINNSTDISAFVDRGGKLIFYHGLSDSGPPWPYTVEYFHKVAERQGRMHRPFPRERGERGDSDDILRQGEDFMKLYLVPNMGHCGGNASTDRFDMLTPMVNWIENDITPNTVMATGVNFSSTLGTLTGLPTTRSRPLCPYPQTLRYTGPQAGDISAAANYSCVEGNFEKFDDRR